MCSLLGLQGVRTVDSQILMVLGELINTEVKGFLIRNSHTLHQLTEYYQIPEVLHRVERHLTGMHRFMDAVITIGFGLELRQQLYAASGQHMTEAFPAVAQAMAEISHHIDPFCTCYMHE